MAYFGRLIAIPQFTGNLPGEGFPFAKYQANQLVKAYIPAGGSLTAVVERDSKTGHASFDFTVSGYFVDAP